MHKGNPHQRTVHLELTASELKALKFAVVSDYEVVKTNSGREISWKEDVATLAAVLAKIERLESGQS